MSDVEMLTEVTPEEWGAIVADLETALKVSQKNGEDLSAYAARLANKANKLSDEAWDGLSEVAQKWINGALTAIELGNDLPIPSDGTDATPAPEEEVEAAAEKPKKKQPPADRTRPEPKEAKSAKKSKANSKSEGGARRGRKGLFNMAATIKPLMKENPYRDGSKGFAWYSLYEKGMTVEEAIDAGVPRAQVRFDMHKEHVSVTPAK